MRLILIVVNLCIALCATAQNEIQYFSDENFAFEVKQIDEFIERFNNSENTLIRQYIKDNYGKKDLPRQEILKSLFNQKDESWSLRDVDLFITQIVNRDYNLQFEDKDWYAKLDCSVDYLGEEFPMTMIMNVERNQKTNAKKWVITSVNAQFLDIPESSDKSKSINPASHGTNFIALDRALEDTSNMKNYVSSDFNPDQLTLFMSLLSCKKVSIKQVDRIQYHFLQFEGWAFTVKNFERDDKNSGWLISKLERLDDYQKDEYKKSILNLK